MKDLIKKLEDLPLVAKVLLVIIYGLYGNLLRLFRSLEKNSILGIILAVILLISYGLFIVTIIDLICVILGKDIIWID